MIEKSNSTSPALATIAILGQPPSSNAGILVWAQFLQLTYCYQQHKLLFSRYLTAGNAKS
ncbi:hypothetical protein [Nitrosomonas sp. ANs5]|uniref:hypothetical protein n=1 Tax=Nitrosomonas sp. ANs5 TaxID=3423941 RepID=UPI003D33101A